MIIRLTDNVQHSVYTYTYTSNTFSACIDTVPIAHRLTAQCLMNNYMGFVLKNMYGNFQFLKNPLHICIDIQSTIKLIISQKLSTNLSQYVLFFFMKYMPMDLSFQSFYKI